ncbi:hypothetical protein CSM15_003567 [Salmonella enterica subsp. diarizonae]|nr:hypothetical protein [Salmonella enterica subsp. diarizonae]
MPKTGRTASLESLMLLNGKPVPDNRADVTRRLDDHIPDWNAAITRDYEQWDQEHFGLFIYDCLII